MNIVLIPCYNRPNLLANTLECIIKAKDAENQQYVFVQDVPENKEITKLINSFPYLNHHVQIKERKYEGNAYAIGTGLKYAHDLIENYTKDLLFIIEEDVYIGHDFFVTHEQIHKQFNPFAVSTCYNHFRKRQEFFSHRGYVYKDNHYQQIGTSIYSWWLPNIIEHFNTNYYENPDEYCAEKFPVSDIPYSTSDAIPAKVMESLNQFCIYPFVPRSYHAGIKGINTYANEDIRPINLGIYANPAEFEMKRVPDYRGY